MENPTLTAIGDAMDAAALRHSVLANNIANAKTPGFRASDVVFQARLQALRESDGPSTSIELRGDAPFNGTSYVDVQHEMALMTANAVRYESLAALAASHFHQMQSIISDGRSA